MPPVVRSPRRSGRRVVPAVGQHDEPQFGDTVSLQDGAQRDTPCLTLEFVGSRGSPLIVDLFGWLPDLSTEDLRSIAATVVAAKAATG